MKAFLFITLFATIHGVFAAGDRELCIAFDTINNNESTLKSLNSDNNTRNLPVYIQTKAAYHLIYFNTLIAGQTGSLRKFVADMRACGSASSMIKEFSIQELKNQWSPEDYAQLIAKLSTKGGITETMLYQAEMGVTVVAGVVMVGAMLFGGEAAATGTVIGISVIAGSTATLTSIGTWLYNRSPPALKGLSLELFDDAAIKKIDDMAWKLASDKMNALIQN